MRETREEAVRAAEALIDKSDISNTGAWADMKNNTESTGQMRINEMGSRGNLWLTDTIWMGVNKVRGGAGTMFVGTPEMVAGVIREYYDAGVRHFIMKRMAPQGRSGNFRQGGSAASQGYRTPSYCPSPPASPRNRKSTE